MYNACQITSELHYTTGNGKIQSFYLLNTFLNGAGDLGYRKKKYAYLKRKKEK